MRCLGAASVPGDVSGAGEGFVTHCWWSQCCGVCCGLGWWGSVWERGLAGPVLAGSSPRVVTVCLVGGPGGGGSTNSAGIVVPCGCAHRGGGRGCLEKLGAAAMGGRDGGGGGGIKVEMEEMQAELEDREGVLEVGVEMEVGYGWKRWRWVWRRWDWGGGGGAEGGSGRGRGR